MIAALAALLLQQPNPEYRYWAGCAPGAWSKMKISSNQNGMAFEGEVKATLVSISAERATVERTTRMKIGERTVEETSREEVKARDDKAGKILAESDAEIEIAGRKLPCRLYEMAQDQKGVKMKVKWWASADIPSGLARMEMVPEGADKAIITITAVAWEKK
jgi:hypothetical protein